MHAVCLFYLNINHSAHLIQIAAEPHGQPKASNGGCQLHHGVVCCMPGGAEADQMASGIPWAAAGKGSVLCRALACKPREPEQLTN